MKNRGFTLLELLGVIVILALLTTLVFPSVLNVIKKSSEETDKLSMDLISNAADLYIENNPNDFKKRNGSKFIIDMNELMEDGNLPSNIRISDIDNIEEKCVQVLYTNNKYSYELKDKGTCESFIALPEDYYAVEYIEGTGTQYIDTNTKPTNTTKAEVLFELTNYSSSQYILGSRETVSSTILFGLNGKAGYTSFNAIFMASKTSLGVRQIKKIYKNSLEVEYTEGIGFRGKFVYNDIDNNKTDISYTEYNVDGITGNNPNIYLFAFNPSNIHEGIKVYNCKIWNNDVLIRNFIPCYRKSDGEIGMYDIVEDKFYTNSGTGTFVKGKDI